MSNKPNKILETDFHGIDDILGFIKNIRPVHIIAIVLTEEGKSFGVNTRMDYNIQELMMGQLNATMDEVRKLMNAEQN